MAIPMRAPLARTAAKYDGKSDEELEALIAAASPPLSKAKVEEKLARLDADVGVIED